MIHGQVGFSDVIKVLHDELDDVVPSPFPFITLATSNKGILVEIQKPSVSFYVRGAAGAKPILRHDSYLLEGTSDISMPSFRLLSRMYAEAGNALGEKGLAGYLPFKNKKGQWNILSGLLSDHNRNSLQVRDFRPDFLKVKEYGQKCLLSGLRELLDDFKGEVYGPLGIPFDNLKELLVNAIAHNAYELGDPYIEVREGKIEIINNGYEKPLLGVSSPLNPSLFSVCKDLGLSYGAGLGSSILLKPSSSSTIAFNEGLVVLSVENHLLITEEKPLIGETKIEPDGEIKTHVDEGIKAEVLKLIQNNVRIKRNNIAKSAKISSRTLDRVIKALKEDGKILGRTSNKNGEWVLPE